MSRQFCRSYCRPCVVRCMSIAILIGLFGWFLVGYSENHKLENLTEQKREEVK